jgi:hypothetical protein
LPISGVDVTPLTRHRDASSTGVPMKARLPSDDAESRERSFFRSPFALWALGVTAFVAALALSLRTLGEPESPALAQTAVLIIEASCAAALAFIAAARRETRTQVQRAPPQWFILYGLWSAAMFTLARPVVKWFVSRTAGILVSGVLSAIIEIITLGAISIAVFWSYARRAVPPEDLPQWAFYDDAADLCLATVAVLFIITSVGRLMTSQP